MALNVSCIDYDDCYRFNRIRIDAISVKRNASKGFISSESTFHRCSCLPICLSAVNTQTLRPSNNWTQLRLLN